MRKGFDGLIHPAAFPVLAFSFRDHRPDAGPCVGIGGNRGLPVDIKSENPDVCRRAACPAVVLCGGAGSVSVCRLAVAARMDAGRSAQALSIYRCFAGVDFPVALAGDAALLVVPMREVWMGKYMYHPEYPVPQSFWLIFLSFPVLTLVGRLCAKWQDGCARRSGWLPNTSFGPD